jgi:hypothetical protein
MTSFLEQKNNTKVSPTSFPTLDYAHCTFLLDEEIKAIFAAPTKPTTHTNNNNASKQRDDTQKKATQQTSNEVMSSTSKNKSKGNPNSRSEYWSSHFLWNLDSCSKGKQQSFFHKQAQKRC